MKQIVCVLLLGLLFGCTSEEPINGVYDVDAKYSALHFAQAANKSIPEDTNGFDEDGIKKQEQFIRDQEIVVSVDFPELRFSRKSPTQIDDQLQLKKVGENQFILLTELKGETKEVTLKYDPDEQSLYWGTYKYIKR